MIKWLTSSNNLAINIDVDKNLSYVVMTRYIIFIILYRKNVKKEAAVHAVFEREALLERP